jgi:capsular polysaccharide biosynthesis protein
MLTGCHTLAFGHWMTEYLPKYLGALNAGVLPPMPVLIDTGMPPQHRQSLEMFAPPGTDIIEVPLQAMVQVRELWCAATPTFMSLHERVNEKWRWDLYGSPPWRFKKVIERMSKALDGTRPAIGAKRIFLARPATRHRRLVNSAAIEAIAREHGFEIVYPEALSFVEQATLLRSASFVVGPEGSALCLTFFSGPGTKVAILSHPDVEGLPNLTAITDELEIETVILTGPFHEKNEAYPQFSSYLIDEDKFRLFLEGWLA